MVSLGTVWHRRACWGSSRPGWATLGSLGMARQRWSRQCSDGRGTVGQSRYVRAGQVVACHGESRTVRARQSWHRSVRLVATRQGMAQQGVAGGGSL